jgi:hypothetical protein
MVLLGHLHAVAFFFSQSKSGKQVTLGCFGPSHERCGQEQTFYTVGHLVSQGSKQPTWSNHPRESYQVEYCCST